MKVSQNLTPLISVPAPERQSEPVGQPRPSAEQLSGQRLPRPSSEVAAARELLERQEQRRGQAGAEAYTAMDLKSRRAVAAYSTLQASDERDYVARVLGIDTYA